jgi:RimJ/RimL family protein N-acetyltransferase
MAVLLSVAGSERQPGPVVRPWRRGDMAGLLAAVAREYPANGIGYWTAADQRGRSIAPAAVRTVTEWAFRSFGAQRLPGIMLVHDLDNLGSCRVAGKSGYPFRELSPAKPPLWFTDGHIHFAAAPR